MDIQQMFFTNLQLLGLDAFAMERRWRIPFNREMFQLPNKKGFEAIVYFLFEKLNPAHCREQFRDCWPVTDKKQEQDFRRVVKNWLTEIAKETDSHFPRIVASMFLSPGGDKFYRLMFAFSRYVISKSIINECGYKQRDFLKYPVLTTQNQAMGSVIVNSLVCGTIRHRRQALEHIEQAGAVQEEWKHFAGEHVKRYRSLNKNIRDLERDLKMEIQKSLEMRSASGSPVSRKRVSGVMDYDLDVQNVKRAQKVQEVRDLWKLIDNLSTSKTNERQIMECILQGTFDNYKISASDLDVKVPDILLRECEKELHRRGVENIYEGGKLNLLSLIHLWNLSLHLYIEKLHKVGVPEFEKDVPTINTQVHTHHAHLTNIQTLRTKLEKEIIPDLKESIAKLKMELDERVFASLSPNSVRTTSYNEFLKYLNSKLHKSLGFGLMPPTPPVSFNPSDVKTPAGMTVNMHTVPQTEQVNTPEAALQLMDSINKRIVSAQSSSPLVQGTPVYAPRQDLSTRQSSKIPTAKFLRPLTAVIAELEAREIKQQIQRHKVRFKDHPEYMSNRHSRLSEKSPLSDGEKVTKRGQKQGTVVKSTANNRMLRQPQTMRGRGGKTVKQTSSGTRLVKHDIQSESNAKQLLSSQVASPASIRDKDLFKKPEVSMNDVHRSPALQPVIDKHLDSSVLSSIPRSPPAHDILADRLVDEIMSGNSSPRDVLGQTLSDDDLLGGTAFVKKDKIARTPPDKPTWHEALLENSYGPLSSTRIDHSKAIIERGDRDKVATQLFSLGGANDGADTKGMKLHNSDQLHDHHSKDKSSSNEPTPVTLHSSSRQETYGAELDEQLPVKGSNVGKIDHQGSPLFYDYQTEQSNPLKKSPHELLSFTEDSSHKSKTVGGFKHRRNKGVEEDPYGEFTLKFSALSPNVSGIGHISMSDSNERTKTPDIADIQQKLTFRSDLTESYRHLSETVTPTLPDRNKKRNNKILTMDEKYYQSPSQSKQSNSITIESYKSSIDGTTDSNLLVTFGTPPDIDPTPSYLVKEGGLRALDVVNMSPTKEGGVEYNLGIFDLDLNGGQLHSVQPKTSVSPDVVTDIKSSSHSDVKSSESFQLLSDAGLDELTQNHVKWRDLEQEIRNASEKGYDSQLTSLASDLEQDNVRVIEFQNGLFNEFVEKSPNLKQKQKVSIDDSTSESSDTCATGRKFTAINNVDNLGKEAGNPFDNLTSQFVNNSPVVTNSENNDTDSLIARYRKLRLVQQGNSNNHIGLVKQSGLPAVSDNFFLDNQSPHNFPKTSTLLPSPSSSQKIAGFSLNEGQLGLSMTMNTPLSHQSLSLNKAQQESDITASPLLSLQQYSSLSDVGDNVIRDTSPFREPNIVSTLHSPHLSKVNASPGLKENTSFLREESPQQQHQQQLVELGEKGKNDVGSRKFTLDDFEFNNTSPSTSQQESALSSINDILVCGPLGEQFGKSLSLSKRSPYMPSTLQNKKGSPKGNLLLNSLPISPLTEAIHTGTLYGQSTAATRRISLDNFPDIFGEDESLLVPPSPPP